MDEQFAGTQGSASKQWVYTLVVRDIALISRTSRLSTFFCHSYKQNCTCVLPHSNNFKRFFVKPNVLETAMQQGMSDIVGFFSTINEDPKRGESNMTPWLSFDKIVLRTSGMIYGCVSYVVLLQGTMELVI